MTIVTEVHDDFVNAPAPRRIDCDGSDAVGHPQACLNYHSISVHYPLFHTLTCPYYRPLNKVRPVSALYTKQRDIARFKPQFVNLPANGKCSPDEYPPAAICDANDGYASISSMADNIKNRPGFNDRGQRIRLLESADNSRAGSLFGGCPGVAHYDYDNTHMPLVTKRARRGGNTIYHSVRANFQRVRFTMDFSNLQLNLADDGLTDNICQPTINGVRHPGFALLNGDLWFGAHPQEAGLTAGWAKGAGRKREDGGEEVGRLVYVDANCTRPASQDELRALFGFDECSDDTCSRELEALKVVAASVHEAVSPSSPVEIETEATVAVQSRQSDGVPPSQPGSHFVVPDLPDETGKP